MIHNCRRRSEYMTISCVSAVDAESITLERRQRLTCCEENNACSKYGCFASEALLAVTLNQRHVSYGRKKAEKRRRRRSGESPWVEMEKWNRGDGTRFRRVWSVILRGFDSASDHRGVIEWRGRKS